MNQIKAILRPVLRPIKFHIKRHILAYKIGNTRILRVILGADCQKYLGWISTDIDTLNILKKDDWSFHFDPHSISALLAEHVWEHLSISEGEQAAKLCFEYLLPGGHLRVAVPDGLKPDQEYINKVKVGEDDHKVLFDYKSLSNIFLAAGFQVKMLEYYDETGDFHYNQWDNDAGLITRSRDHDQRNVDGQLKYTSVILDAIKAPTLTTG